MKRSKLWTVAVSVIFDLLVVAGCCITDYGLWLAWRPLGFILGGLELAAAGIFFGYNVGAVRRHR